ncbi:MAG: GNAT family N-acetyltransferase [Pseudomonadales bacterium]|nr:GNAT family N-acetyltransferase [Pseudomonadales bacterium]
MALGLRDYEVFRGDPAALPDEMAAVVSSLVRPPDVLRVAKLGEQIIGCYAMHEPTLVDDQVERTFLLAMVAVEPNYRSNGVGRWLVGHAIGVAETKGGRHLAAQLAGPAAFFIGLGFHTTAEGFQFDMYPE